MKKLNKTFILSLSIVILLLTLLPVFSYPAFFLGETNIASFGQLYANSQYVKGEATQQRIDDATLYVYAGYAYIQGEDPTTINFEHPPLGKYILGLSYALFNNSLILNLVVYAGFLTVFASLLQLFTKNKWLILGSLLFLGTTRVIYVNVAQGMLDIFSSLLLLLIFRTLFSQLQATKKYIVAGVLIGALAATKYPFPSIALPILLTLTWAYTSKQLLSSIISLPVAAATYLASYTVYFMNHTLKEFIAFEWFRLKWWVVDRNIPPFLIFRTLFFGSFQDWRNLHTVKSAVWSFSWPLLFIGQLFGILVSKVDVRIIFVFLYATIQLGLYALGSASYDRYLISLIPLWILAVVSGLSTYKNDKLSILSATQNLFKN